jgi:hypothetical protein
MEVAVELQRFRMEKTLSETYDLAKAGFDAAMAPVASLIEKIAGPVAEELGLTFQDSVKVYRFKRQLRLWKEVKQIIVHAGVEPEHVPLKTLHAIVENASLEENDDLQNRWAALLANAATHKYEHTTFPGILRDLSHDDADLLRTCLHAVLSPPAESDPLWQKNLTPVIDRWNLSREGKGLNISVESLIRQRLLTEDTFTVNSERPRQTLTWLGYNFALACEDPTNLPKM